MRALAAAVAAFLLFAASACGGHSQTKAERDAVTRYIDEVNVVERLSERPLVRASLAYRHFSTTPAGLRREQGQFAAAAAAFAALHRKVARIDTPTAALRLRARLLALIDAETSVARELAVFARFLPQFRSTLAPLAAANTQLSAGLAHVPTPKPKRVPRSKLKAARAAYLRAVAASATLQADVVSTYTTRIGVIAQHLRTLRPPAVLAPTYRTQLRTLEHVRVAGDALATALRTGKFARVAVLDRNFRAAALAASSLAAQRAEIAAVRGYDAQVRRISTLAGAVEREREALQKTLG